MDRAASALVDVASLQRARYEITRATLRGTGDLRPAEHHARAFFEDMLSLAAPGDLHDAVVLLQYLDTAARIGESSISTGEVKAWAATSAPTSPHCLRTRPRPAAVRGCSGQPLTWR